MNYTERMSSYNKAYWERNETVSLYAQNGFNEYPTDIYNHFTNIVNSLVENAVCKILDLGCGNGLLLKHLSCHCSAKIIPYGVDFLERSIISAKEVVNSDYNANFYLMNINEFDFRMCSYDIIIIDPYMLDQNDLKYISEKSLECAKVAVIFYLYSDVIKGLSIESIGQFRSLRFINKQILDYDKVSFAIVKK